MTTFPTSSTAPEALLAEQDFVRALVRSLLRGGDGEEDIVQKTWVRAMTSPPRDAGRARAWLSSVVRNLVRDHVRGKRRRQARERDAEHEVAAPSTADVVQREHDRKRVVDAVLALDEPYRATLLMRYWEELSPAEIATRLGVPDGTVRSRLHRGLEQLRHKLDRDFGSRRSWIVALTPCAALDASPVTPVVAGAVLMSKSKSLFAVCGLILAGLTIWAVWGPPVLGPTSDPDDAPPSLAQSRLEGNQDPVTQDETDAPSEDASSERAELVTTGAFTVTGIARCQGLPYPNCRVVLRFYDGYETHGTPAREASVGTDARGEFSWHGDPPRTAGMVTAVSSTKARGIQCSPAAIHPGDESAHLTVTVSPFECRLHGFVRDQDGNPIPNATIQSTADHRTTSDDAGHYEFLVGRGAHARHMKIWADGFAPSSQDAPIPETAEEHRLDFTLAHGGRIAGRVVDEAGEPIAGARVSTSLKRYVIESDEDGQFVLPSVDATVEHYVLAEKLGYLRSGESARVGAEDFVIVLKRGSTILGVVLDGEGEPVAGAHVRCYDARFFNASSSSYSDENGEFELRYSQTGARDLSVERRGFVKHTSKVEIREDMGPIEVRLERGGSIRGIVADATGAPLPGARVVCRGRNEKGWLFEVGTKAFADENGAFAIEDLPDYALTVVAYLRGYLPGSQPGITRGMTGVTVTLQRGASVAGRVLDAATRQPIESFELVISNEDDVDERFRKADRVNGTDGYWKSSFGGFPLGQQLWIAISAEGYARQKLTAEAMVDPPREQVLVLMKRGSSIQGIVHDDSSGKPVAGATVKLVAGSGDLGHIGFDTVPTVTTNEKGEFEFKTANPGESRLVVFHDDYAHRIHGPFAVPEDSTRIDVKIPIDKGNAIAGRIVGFDGIELTAHLMAYGDIDDSRREEIGLEREFRFEGLSEGRYWVALHAKERSFLRSQFVMIEGTDVLDFELRENYGNCSVQLSIVGLESGELQFRALGDTPGSIRFLDFSGGTVLIEGLAPGKHRVRVQDEKGRVDHRQELEVSATGRTTVTVKVEEREPRGFRVR